MYLKALQQFVVEILNYAATETLANQSLHIKTYWSAHGRTWTNTRTRITKLHKTLITRYKILSYTEQDS